MWKCTTKNLFIYTCMAQKNIYIYLSHYLNWSENTSPHVTHINISITLMSRMCEGDVILYVLLFVVLWDNLCHNFCHFLQCFKNILFITFAPDWFDVWENLGTVQKFILNQLHKEWSHMLKAYSTVLIKMCIKLFFFFKYFSFVVCLCPQVWLIEIAILHLNHTI